MYNQHLISFSLNKIDYQELANQLKTNKGKTALSFREKMARKAFKFTAYYDSMISKLITVAQTRDEAILKMKRALEEYIIEGIKTTIPFHRQLLKDEKFLKGDFTTKFMDDFEMK